MLFSLATFSGNLTAGVTFPIVSNFLASLKVRIYWIPSDSLELPGAAPVGPLVPAWSFPLGSRRRNLNLRDSTCAVDLIHQVFSCESIDNIHASADESRQQAVK
jgi:hypothetical protein